MIIGCDDVEYDGREAVDAEHMKLIGPQNWFQHKS